MQNYFVDLHIHIGRNSKGEKVKMATARNLTFENVVEEAFARKGMDVLGVVDTISPRVMRDIEEMLEQGSMVELPEGGLQYKNKVTILLGGEIETTEKNGGDAHQLVYFPTIRQMKEFTRETRKNIRNVNLSAQKCYLTCQELFERVDALGGVLIPAHAFTPYKGIYGSCTDRLHEILKDESLEKIFAIELGLSADTNLADHIHEVANLSFISNSDAHSLPKIGREYNVFALEAPNYQEVMMALRRQGGRHVVANYGMDPKLGKYHRTNCLVCEYIAHEPPPVLVCPQCGSTKIIKGVLDRIMEIADFAQPRHPGHRPPYQYQIPLEFVPKIGKRTLNKLVDYFGSEMAVLHIASEEDLAQVVGEELAHQIILARMGKLPLLPGGGGTYGRVLKL